MPYASAVNGKSSVEEFRASVEGDASEPDFSSDVLFEGPTGSVGNVDVHAVPPKKRRVKKQSKETVESSFEPVSGKCDVTVHHGVASVSQPLVATKIP